jgi:hypothetical protein
MRSPYRAYRSILFTMAFLTAAAAQAQQCGADGSDCVTPQLNYMSQFSYTCSYTDFDCIAQSIFWYNGSGNYTMSNLLPSGSFQDSNGLVQVNNSGQYWFFDWPWNGDAGALAGYSSSGLFFGVGSSGMSAGLGFHSASLAVAPPAGFDFGGTVDLIGNGAGAAVGLNHSELKTLDWSGSPSGDVSLSDSLGTHLDSSLAGTGTSGGNSLSASIGFSYDSNGNLAYSRSTASGLSEQAAVSLQDSFSEALTYSETRTTGLFNSVNDVLQAFDGLTYNFARQISADGLSNSSSESMGYQSSSHRNTDTLNIDYNTDKNLDSNADTYQNSHTAISMFQAEAKGSDASAAQSTSSDGHGGTVAHSESASFSSYFSNNLFGNWQATEFGVESTHTASWRNSSSYTNGMSQQTVSMSNSSEDDTTAADGSTSFVRSQNSASNTNNRQNGVSESRYDDLTSGYYNRSTGYNGWTDVEFSLSAVNATGDSATSGGVRTDHLRQISSNSSGTDRTSFYGGAGEEGNVVDGVDVGHPISSYGYLEAHHTGSQSDDDLKVVTTDSGGSLQRVTDRVTSGGGDYWDSYTNDSSDSYGINHSFNRSGAGGDQSATSHDLFLSWSDTSGSHERDTYTEAEVDHSTNFSDNIYDQQSTYWGNSHNESHNLYTDQTNITVLNTEVKDVSGGGSVDAKTQHNAAHFVQSFHGNGFGSDGSVEYDVEGGYTDRQYDTSDVTACAGPQCTENILGRISETGHHTTSNGSDFANGYGFHSQGVSDPSSVQRWRFGSVSDDSTGLLFQRFESDFTATTNGSGSSDWGGGGQDRQGFSQTSIDVVRSQESYTTNMKGGLFDYHFLDLSTYVDDTTNNRTDYLNGAATGTSVEKLHYQSASSAQDDTTTLMTYTKLLNQNDNSWNRAGTSTTQTTADTGGGHDYEILVDYSDFRFNTPPVGSVWAHGRKHTDWSDLLITTAKKDTEHDTTSATTFHNDWTLYTAANGYIWGNNDITQSTQQQVTTSGSNISQHKIDVTDITKNDASGWDFYHSMLEKTWNFAQGKLLSVVSSFTEYGNKALLALIKSKQDLDSLSKLCANMTPDGLLNGFDPTVLLPVFSQACTDQAIQAPQVCLEPQPGSSSNAPAPINDPRNPAGNCPGWSKT